ncbi:hypothetical protein, partial [Nocardiopsis lucentensis]|uniref:hypothetical protein n=1 Tax=Nocardiopsis lucentensis TaxID=53441 RepID=UPI0019D3FB6B
MACSSSSESSFSCRSAADQARESNLLCAVSDSGFRAAAEGTREAASSSIPVFFPMALTYPLTRPIPNVGGILRAAMTRSGRGAG